MRSKDPGKISLGMYARFTPGVHCIAYQAVYFEWTMLDVNSYINV